MNIFCLKAYNNKQVLSVHALILFKIFSFLVDEKIKLKVLSISFEIEIEIGCGQWEVGIRGVNKFHKGLVLSQKGCSRM